MVMDLKMTDLDSAITGLGWGGMSSEKLGQCPVRACQEQIHKKQTNKGLFQEWPCDSA